MTILLVHYHLRAGGVTRVVQVQASALRQLGHDVIIASSGPVDGWDFPTLVVPELDYRTSGSVPIDPLLAAAADLWIIHNPTLGLNAGYPDLIHAAAEREIPLILQIHDFVEDGRPDNYQLVRDRHDLYPNAPHVHYATINRRDLGILHRAGLPPSRCHYLPNSIDPPHIRSTGHQDPVVFYPVRGIRRKNLGELCLLAAHAPQKTTFAVALRSSSEEPAFIHDDWVKFAAHQGLPVSFDVVGPDPDSFETWLARASHFITTSISEGFGLTFLDPAFLGKPLIGRDLPEITRDFSPAGTLYQSLPVPLGHLPGLKDTYTARLAAAMSAYGRKLNEEELEKAWCQFTSSGTVDFGNLPEERQREVIRSTRFPELAHWLTRALATPLQSFDTTPWTLASYAERLQSLLLAPEPPGPLTWIDPHKILSQFLDPRRFHFLRSPIVGQER